MPDDLIQKAISVLLRWPPERQEEVAGLILALDKVKTRPGARTLCPAEHPLPRGRDLDRGARVAMTSAHPIDLDLREKRQR